CMSLVWISLSYCGFNAAVYVAGEVRDPERNVPRALMVGTIATTIFYLLLNTVFVWAPELNTVAGQEQVAAIAARTVGGPNLEWTMRLIVIVSLFTSVSAMIMTGPRVYAKMADDRLLPSWLRFAGPVPRRALLFQAGLALVVVHVSTLKQLLSYLGFTLSITAALTVSSLLWARHSLPVSLGVRIAAGLYVASTLIIAFLAASRTPLESGLALLTLVGAFGVYWVVRPRAA
ncbi:amino acid permease, partial [bacterium]|nr:amino acid permease [bacterium]